MVFLRSDLLDWKDAMNDTLDKGQFWDTFKYSGRGAGRRTTSVGVARRGSFDHDAWSPLGETCCCRANPTTEWEG